MDYTILGAIVGGIIALAVIFTIIYFVCKRHSDFIRKADKIKSGMSVDEVLQIMGCAATTTEENGDRLVAEWEKSQWKGIQNGGTLVRSIKVVFVNGRVDSVIGKNLDKSTFV